MAHYSEEHGTPSSSATRRPPMQRLRVACDECRRRKLRCDGQQPQCGLCQETGILCEVTQRGVRGPKKGHLKALKNRLVHLEAMLEDRLLAHQQQEDLHGNAPDTNEATLSASPGGVAEIAVIDTTEVHLPQATAESQVFVPAALTPLSNGRSFSSTLAASNICIPPTDILHAELDQLYLDRVHPSIPILHQRRYLSWSKSSIKTESSRCLQYAMWSLASLLSAQFYDMVEPLYQETKGMLERLSVEPNEHSGAGAELAQAWVLLVTFESMRAYHRQAWMSAGRAFRLVQAMRYHDIDSPIHRRGSYSPQCGDLIGVEEKRRVFWMAYFLDHVISMRDDWPITLNEHVICTRLPAPDAEFQTGHYELGPFLSEAMTDPNLKVRSSFNECLILTTICGRSLLQSQRHNISKAYGDMVLDCAEQRQWLDGLLTERLDILSQCYPSPIESYDPLLLFVHILGQATVVYFCKAMIESAAIAVDPLNKSCELSNYQNRALEASSTIIYFATTLRELPVSKIHPLMPIPLFFCAEFLYHNMHRGEPFQLRLQELFHIFRELKNVNSHEKSYLDLLPQSCISKTNELFNHISR
ncbi:fungal-specific transcription factor domain-containing protein [Talaromyces proteolyticus]|uniref:Fungal-specific transcription factor domain-containing protein n=1 Tax=Talaromyces proteolyticus TaxID=1131652 RepID=A0AAD4KIU1_9EURO|nr:fungal-specific transcription factor domain-containing protein [Talaromyces proteolyticus]KAH8690305.1 fungal-specific transcription factor domain-containing protein [Talaromyces proteolyticus]